VADQDSFITEVSDEVRRDKLFALMRKYGWIAVALVVVIVGGAAIFEWRKAQAIAQAQKIGDEVLVALGEESPQAQADALSGLSTQGEGGQKAVIDLLKASSLMEAGDGDGAAALLEALSSDTATPQIYRDIARLKLAVSAGNLSAEDRISVLGPLLQPGSPLRVLAMEQKALIEIESGTTDAAIETLQGLVSDAETTEDLRRRASQLIVALGGALGQG